MPGDVACSISMTNGATSGSSIGDFATFLGKSTRRIGHVCVYINDSVGWVSDYKQGKMVSPYRNHTNALSIYRWRDCEYNYQDPSSGGKYQQSSETKTKTQAENAKAIYNYLISGAIGFNSVQAIGFMSAMYQESKLYPNSVEGEGPVSTDSGNVYSNVKKGEGLMQFTGVSPKSAYLKHINGYGNSYNSIYKSSLNDQLRLIEDLFKNNVKDTGTDGKGVTNWAKQYKAIKSANTAEGAAEIATWMLQMPGKGSVAEYKKSSKHASSEIEKHSKWIEQVKSLLK